MPATAEQVERLRRMVAEPQPNVYKDEDLAAAIERYPRDVEEAEDPEYSDYDLHAAAEELWQEKAAAVAQDYTFSADGAQYQRSGKYLQYMAQARWHGSRRMARVDVWSAPTEELWEIEEM